MFNNISVGRSRRWALLDRLIFCYIYDAFTKDKSIYVYCFLLISSLMIKKMCSPIWWLVILCRFFFPSILYVQRVTSLYSLEPKWKNDIKKKKNILFFIYESQLNFNRIISVNLWILYDENRSLHWIFHFFEK